MAFDLGAELFHRGVFGAVHAQHGVRVAHGHHGHVDRVIGQWQRPQLTAVDELGRQAGAIEGHLGGHEEGRAHVHGDAAIGLQAGLNDSLHRLHADHVFRGQAGVVHEAGETARAIAALLDLAAVGVHDAVGEVGAAGRVAGLDDEDLVGADAKAPVGQEAVLGRAQGQTLCQRPAGGVEHDEVVARAVHLGETQLHGCRLSACL